MSHEQQTSSNETEGTHERFPDEWRMTDEEMALLFYEGEEGRVVHHRGRSHVRDSFIEKVRLAKKYASQFWDEPIPEEWLDAQEESKQKMLVMLCNARAEAGGELDEVVSYLQPGAQLRFDAGVISPVALHFDQTAEDYHHSEIEHPRFRAIRYMVEAAKTMAEAGDSMAVPQAEYVMFILKSHEDYLWNLDGKGGPRNHSLRGAPWGYRDGLPISMDEYDSYTYAHTYAEFFDGATRRTASPSQDSLL